MSKKSDDSAQVRWWSWLLLFPGVIILWGISIIFLPKWFPEIAERGQFGDSFGVVNALFSGLAFAGVICAIIFQQKELALQRMELALQREELANTRGEMKEQKRAIQKESFERSFFQFLEILEAKYQSTEYVVKVEIDVRKETVQTAYERLKETGFDVVSSFPSKIDGKTYLEIKKKGEDAFFSACIEENWISTFFYMNPYFSLLFKILRFIDQADFSKNFEKKKFYTDILRDQMTNYQLVVLFNLARYPDWHLGLGHGNIDGKIFKDLIEKYSLFLNIGFYGDNWKKDVTFYDRSAFGDRKRPDIDEIFEQNQRKKTTLKKPQTKSGSPSESSATPNADKKINGDRQ